MEKMDWIVSVLRLEFQNVAGSIVVKIVVGGKANMLNSKEMIVLFLDHQVETPETAVEADDLVHLVLLQLNQVTEFKISSLTLSIRVWPSFFEVSLTTWLSKFIFLAFDKGKKVKIKCILEV